MGRRSTIHKYIDKEIGGIKILEPLGLRGVKPQRMWVKCLCLECQKVFEAVFHNVYRGNYKSCGCLQYEVNAKSPRWAGYGEISQSVFGKIKEGARIRNLDFDVSIEMLWDLFLKQDKKCALSGIKIWFPTRALEYGSCTASLDRIDSSKGYTKDNIQWVHRIINFMKQRLNNEEFLEWIDKIYKHNHE